MKQIIAVIILLAGFIAPFLSQGKLASTYFFWFGFLLLLSQKKDENKSIVWKREARIGLLCNVLGSILFLLTIIIIPKLSSGIYAEQVLMATSWITRPISEISKLLFPHPKFEISGGVFFKISFIRISLENFFNIMVYIVLGAVIAHWLKKRCSSNTTYI